MKIISIILSFMLIFGLFAVNTFAYSRPENIASEYNDFENGVGDWTNGLITGCTDAKGDVTESATTLTITSDASGTHGKYLAVNNAGDLSKTATLVFDMDLAKKTAAAAQSNAEVIAGDYFGFEFDFKLPADASSATALELVVWDTRSSRNRATLVSITPSTGVVKAGSNTYTISKDTWYKMKLECVVGSALQRLIIMDDSGKRLFISNINSSSKYLPTIMYGIITFSQGGANCKFYLDNTKAYTFAADDLNADMVLFTDKTLRTINLENPSFEVEAINKFTSFNTTEVPFKAFVAETKIRIDNTTKNNDIKISLKEDAATRLITTISPNSGKVKLGNASSSTTVGGLSMDSGTWYDVKIIYNSETDYQRVEITNSSTDETQVFSGLSGYLPTDISAFNGVQFETSCTEAVVTEFDGLNIHTSSKQYAADFYTMDSYEIEADANEIIVKTSAKLSGFSDDKLIFKNSEGDIIPAQISYDCANEITIIPSSSLKENEKMQLIFSKDILIGGEKPKFDSVLDFKVLIDEIYMDYSIKADGEAVFDASDLKGKSNITCEITSTNRMTEDFSGMYVMAIMDKNHEIKGICAEDISLSASVPSDSVSLSLSIPDGGENLEVYVMFIDNLQSSKAIAKYIKIH